jgi:membrane protein
MPLWPRVKAAGAAARRRSPALDHLARAYARYQKDTGNELAASVTLPGFLAFFPLLALAFAGLGFVVSNSVSAQRDVLNAVRDYLPGLLCSSQVPAYPCAAHQIDIHQLSGQSAAAGIVGLVGLIWAGLGWVDAFRTALRRIWHQSTDAGFVLLAKLKDLGVLVLLGIGLAASLFVAAAAGSATTWVLDGLGLGHAAWANLALKLAGTSTTLLVDVALFMVVFVVLGQSGRPRRQVARGAALAASGLTVLQLLGATYVHRTTGNPVYGSFAVIVGLIVWINLVVRFTLFCAAWTVTAAGDSDVAPSGTARRRHQHRRRAAARGDRQPQVSADPAPARAPAATPS